MLPTRSRLYMRIYTNCCTNCHGLSSVQTVNAPRFFYRFSESLRPLDLTKSLGSLSSVDPKKKAHSRTAIESMRRCVYLPTFTSWWLNHTFEKYARQIGTFPQVGVNIKNIWNHHLVVMCKHRSEYDICLKSIWRSETNWRESSFMLKCHKES